MGPSGTSAAYVDAYYTFPQQRDNGGPWAFYHVRYPHGNACNSCQLHFQVDNTERCRIQDGMGLSSLHVPDNTSGLGEKKDGACEEADHPSCGDNGNDIHVAYHSAHEGCSNALA